MRAISPSSGFFVDVEEELPDLAADSKASSIRPHLVSLPLSAAAAVSGLGANGWPGLSLLPSCRDRWVKVHWSSPRGSTGAWSWCVAPPPVTGLGRAPGGPSASGLSMSVAPRGSWK